MMNNNRQMEFIEPTQYNIDKIIGQCVHRPFIKGEKEKFPLYARNDGKFDDDSGRSEQWRVSAETKYNSPNNIRKLFITHKGVFVLMYQPIVGSDSSLIKFYGYDSIDKTFDALQFRETYSLERCFNLSKEKNTLLSWMSNQWSCSNLEEIYFDWLIGFTTVGRRLLENIGGRTSQAFSSQKVIMSYFLAATGLETLDKVKALYPRLKVVGYIDCLQDICYRKYMTGTQKTGRKALEELQTPWYKDQVVTDVFKSGPRQAFGYIIGNVNWIDLSTFRTRKYYKFDYDILEGYFADLVDRCNKEKLNITLKGSAKEELDVRSDFEKSLDQLYDKLERNKMRGIFRAMLGATTKEDVDNTLGQLSEAGKKKYSDLLNGK